MKYIYTFIEIQKKKKCYVRQNEWMLGFSHDYFAQEKVFYGDLFYLFSSKALFCIL